MTAEAREIATKAAAGVQESTARRLWEGLLDFAYRKPLGIFGAVVVVFFVGVAFVGPYVTPHDPKDFLTLPLQSPSGEYWFGTDAFGRDVFSRVVAGAAISLTIGFTVTFVNVLMSSVLGLMSGYFMGWVDYLIQRSGEAWGAFPLIIAYFLLISIFGRPQSEGGNVVQVAWDLRILIFALSIGAIFGGSRIIRGATMSIKEQEFVIAARALGASDWRIMRTHIWPNVVPYVIVAASAAVAGIIIAEASLSFLGLGVTPGTPSWGADLSGSNRGYFMQAPWLALAPGLALSLTVLGFNLFGDALRDVLDPRLRGQGRRLRRRNRAA
jgi:ABC-type dipeptide/oligopeptide/nickel transport system permease subunit